MSIPATIRLVAALGTGFTIDGVLDAGVEGSAYSSGLSADSNIGSVAWFLQSGTLPAGVTLNGATGLVEGTLTSGAAGSHTITILAVDSLGQEATSEQTIVVTLPTVTFNPSDKASVIALTGSDLLAQKTSGSSGQWDGVRATLGHSVGKRYFEILHTRLSGTGQNHIVGVSNLSAAVTSGFAGADTNGWGVYVLTGDSYHNSSPTACLAAGASGDIYQIAVDFATGKIWFGRNNTWSGDPAAGTGEAYSGLSGTLYPHVALLNPTFYSSTARFRTAEFTYSPPSSFGPWGG